MMDNLNKKKPLIIIVAAVLLLAGAFLLLRTDKAEPLEEDEAVETIREEYLAVAGEVLSWLDQRRDERGVYTYGSVCPIEDEECLPEEPIHREGFGAIWANYQYYKMTGDESRREVMKYDLEKYADRDLVLEIQTPYWSCFFLKDIALSEILDSGEKEVAMAVCSDTIYEMAFLIPEEFFEAVKSNTLAEAENFLEGEFPGNPNFDIEVVFFAGEKAARSIILESEEDLAITHAAFQETLKRQQNNQNPYETCAAGIASVEMYQATREDVFLTIADFLYQKIEARAFEKEIGAMCALFADKLYEAAEEERYASARDEIMEGLIESSYDNSERSPSVIRNEGGFFSFHEDGIYIEKRVRYNGILAGLFSKASLIKNRE